MRTTRSNGDGIRVAELETFSQEKVAAGRLKADPRYQPLPSRRAREASKSKITRGQQKFARAASRLTPPTDDMLHCAEMRELSALVREGKTSAAKLRAKLEAAANARVVPPLTHTMGGGGLGIGAYAVERLSVFDLLRGLYLPTGAPEWYVPPERRYAFGQSWISPDGLAVASKGSGDLFCVTRARLAGERSFGSRGVYPRTDYRRRLRPDQPAAPGN